MDGSKTNPENPGTPEMEPEVKVFLKAWFAGLMGTMQDVDETAWHKIWKACGAACAHSYTVQIFKQVKQDSPDMDAFLRNLSERMTGGRYERTGPNSMRVTYQSCECDLVRLGLVRSPELCECSVANLRENLEASLEIPVGVDLHASILRGASECVFEVTWTEEASFELQPERQP
jgi:hypothetical protein